MKKILLKADELISKNSSSFSFPVPDRVKKEDDFSETTNN